MVKRTEERAEAVRKVYMLEDLQEVLGLARTTVYRWLRDGRLIPPISDGSGWGRGSRRKRWCASEVHAWVEAGMPSAASWKRQRAARQARR